MMYVLATLDLYVILKWGFFGFGKNISWYRISILVGKTTAHLGKNGQPWTFWGPIYNDQPAEVTPNGGGLVREVSPKMALN